jgi:flagellar biosynthesis anti-sigma factor FlgM
MRIGLDLPLFDVESVHGSKAERATVGRERNGTKKDETQLSADRTGVRSLQAELGILPEIRKDKVEALRRAIANGDYRVSPEKVAEAMYGELSQL